MTDRDSGQERREGGNQGQQQPNQPNKYETDLKKDANREGDRKSEKR